MIALLRRIWRVVFPPKVAWTTKGYRYTHEGFDPSKGSAAYRRSLTQTPSGTPLRLRSEPRADNVRAIRKVGP